MSEKHFCSCTDHKCPMNPVNHDKGCDLCIQKCLKLNEIPSCFFKKYHWIDQKMRITHLVDLQLL
ncbi:MAG: DUF6485 family protein [Fusobacterium sp.]|uniref:DUF6485 family protein n=1 Tax=Fusobacterium sp. TaxID=68766 RepID=UPI002A761F4D|nr:DUF6485 family protein [Fusobacterium sp.]MDY3059529.1 DUF6485 family protein [Fusobacterium sp.]